MWPRKMVDMDLRRVGGGRKKKIDFGPGRWDRCGSEARRRDAFVRSQRLEPTPRAAIESPHPQCHDSLTCSRLYTAFLTPLIVKESAHATIWLDWQIRKDS